MSKHPCGGEKWNGEPGFQMDIFRNCDRFLWGHRSVISGVNINDTQWLKKVQKRVQKYQRLTLRRKITEKKWFPWLSFYFFFFSVSNSRYDSGKQGALKTGDMMVVKRDFIKVAAYSASLLLCVHNYVYKFGRNLQSFSLHRVQSSVLYPALCENNWISFPVVWSCAFLIVCLYTCLHTTLAFKWNYPWLLWIS